MSHRELYRLHGNAVESNHLEQAQRHARNGHEHDKHPFFVIFDSQFPDQKRQENSYYRSSGINNGCLCL